MKHYNSLVLHSTSRVSVQQLVHFKCGPITESRRKHNLRCIDTRETHSSKSYIVTFQKLN